MAYAVAPITRSGAARTLIAAVVAVSVAILAGCNPAGSQPFPGMPPPEVNVTTVQPKTVPVTFEYTGQTAGSREVEVRARVTGILMQRNFTEGEPVARGRSLYTIDRVPFESALARAEADLAGVEARLALAKRTAGRLKPLFDAKAVSQKDYDDAAAAELVADAEAKAARARVADARLNLGYTRVESPISGIAGRSQRSEGSLVSGPDVLLTTITQVNPMYVYFGISEAEHLRMMSESQSGRMSLPRGGKFDVTVKLADGSTYRHKGRMGFSDVRISTTTGTSETRAELPNPEGILRPGQFVRVTLTGAFRPNAILVPQRAVLEGPKGKFVYLVNAESKAEIRPVVVGEWSGDSWAITSGLAAGDRVIVDGVMKIGPGAPVKVADPAAAAKSGAPGAPAASKGGAAGKGDAATMDATKSAAPRGAAEKSAPVAPGAPAAPGKAAK